eukprot:SAG11_NODE_3060_length_2718_cov_5.725468_1_plen_41_part_00
MHRMRRNEGGVLRIALGLYKYHLAVATMPAYRADTAASQS